MSNFDTNASAVLATEERSNFVNPPSATWLRNMAPIASAAADSVGSAQTTDAAPGEPAPQSPVFTAAPAAVPADAPRTLSLHAGAVSGLAASPVATQGDTALSGAEVKTAPDAAARTICSFPHGLSFEGTAEFPCDISVNGSIKGSVILKEQSQLVISESGAIDGTIRARNVLVQGSVKGELDASGGTVAFGEAATCTGSIKYARMSMAEGAEVEATMKKVA